MAAGNYKILPRRPIGLPRSSRFSTLSTVGFRVAGLADFAGRANASQVNTVVN
jgi:hypothetical protein